MESTNFLATASSDDPFDADKASGTLANPEPDRDDEGRLMYYEHQVQRCEFYDGGCLDDVPIEDVRRLFREMLHFTGVGTGFVFPLPPAGLPGCLNEKYDPSEPAANLLELGLEYFSAMVFNERRTMHHRWREARDFIAQIERAAIRKWQREQDCDRARIAEERIGSQLVYFIAADDGPIKIGIAADPVSRLNGLQTSHHATLAILATCQGGSEQERAYHKRFAAKRLRGEWFERCPAILAEIERLNG